MGKAVIVDTLVERFKVVLYERSWSLPLLKQSALKQLLFLTSPQRTLNSTKDAISRPRRLHATACFHEKNIIFEFGDNIHSVTMAWQ